MRVRHFATQHPFSARCPLHRYFVRKFKFSGELMVSYFNLMIATGVFLRQHQSTRGTDHDLMALDSRCIDLPLALRHTDDGYASWIRANRTGELFRHNRPADPVPPHGSGVSPTTKDRSVGTRLSRRQHRAMRLRTPVDHLSRSSGAKRPQERLRYRDAELRPSTIAARCAFTVSRIVGRKNLRAAKMRCDIQR
jgi:hypothetical protein